MLRSLLSAIALFWLSSQAFAEPSRVMVGEFSTARLDPWEQRDFAGRTVYAAAVIDGESVLSATSENSASMLYREMPIDLRQTPILNWSWRIEQRLDPGDEDSRDGDDYVARVYVVKEMGLFGLRSLAINYVWSYQHAKGDQWNNPFAGRNAVMLAQRDASDPTGRWFREERNIVEDFRQLHGIDLDEIDGIAIMTDSDNSQQRAQAWYGDIFFSAE